MTLEMSRLRYEQEPLMCDMKMLITKLLLLENEYISLASYPCAIPGVIRFCTV